MTDKLDLAFRAISLARKHARTRQIRQGSMPCPICKTGTIMYRKTAPLGRFEGECSTAQCVAWTNQ